MEILMLLLLFGAVGIAYNRNKKNILAPCFLLCLAMLVSYCIVLWNYKNWEISINGIFVLYVITAIVAFGAGAFLVNQFFPNDTSLMSFSRQRYTATKYPTKIFLIISVIASAIYIGKIIFDTGFTASLPKLIRQIYDNIIIEGYTPGFLFNQMREIVMAIAYLNMFRLMIRLYSPQDKLKIKLLIVPILLFLLLTMISSDRNILLRFAIFSLCIWVIIYKSRIKKKANLFGKKVTNFEILLKGSFLLMAIALLFYLFGKVKLYTSDLNRMLGIYGGSGLYNFNLWVKDFQGPLVYGKASFARLLSTLNVFLQPFGIVFDTTVPDFGAVVFTSSNGYVYSSNIFSAMQNFVADFGYFGVILFPFLYGLFFQWLYRSAKWRGGFFLIAFCLLIYPVVYFPIVDQLLGRMHLGFLYEIIWPAILYWFAFGKHKVRTERKVLQKRGRVIEKNS